MSDTPVKRIAEPSAAGPAANVTIGTGRDKLTIPLQGTNLAIMIAILWQLLGSYKDLPKQVEQIAKDVSEIRSNDQAQATQIGSLTARVETLEGDNKDLEDRIEELEEAQEPNKSVAELESELKKLKKQVESKGAE